MSMFRSSDLAPAIGSAGRNSYWKPDFNILESSCELVLVNSRQVPGRKADPADASWLARLLWESVQTGNRLRKVLENANIKLDSVASDSLGVFRPKHDRGAGAGGNRPGRSGRTGAWATTGEAARVGAGVGRRCACCTFGRNRSRAWRRRSKATDQGYLCQRFVPASDDSQREKAARLTGT